MTLDRYLDIPKKTEEKEIRVSFRMLMRNEVPSTDYSSHGMYYYPAKFIPQVVRFAIKEYTDKGNWVFDPFAGSGTVCVESYLTMRNCIAYDINPILEVLVKAKTLRVQYEDSAELKKQISNLLYYNGKLFIPKWKNIKYWYPEEILNYLEKLWGYIHYECQSRLKPLLVLGLLKISREFSYTDDQVPKLFKSKIKIEKINQLVKGNWKTLLNEKLINYTRALFSKALEFTKYAKRITYEPKIIAKGGIDVLDKNIDLPRNVDLLITSPPYLIAHEYIRSTKLELYWLGYTDADVKRFYKAEIPYNNPKPINIRSKTFQEYRKIISSKKPSLLTYYDKYFYSIIGALEKFSPRINKYMAIFVGPASLAGVEIPIHKIIIEHFTSDDYIHVKTYIDEIKARRVFRKRKNPNPEGITHEYLVILKKMK